MTEEIYPMPSFPTLIVEDVEVSSNFYQNALGFKHIFTMPINLNLSFDGVLNV